MTPLSLPPHPPIRKIVNPLAMRLPVTKLPDEPLTGLHVHLAHPVRTVIVNRALINYTVFIFYANGTDRDTLYELSLQDPTAAKDNIPHSRDIFNREDRLLEQHSIVTIIALQQFQKTKILLLCLRLVSFTRF